MRRLQLLPLLLVAACATATQIGPRRDATLRYSGEWWDYHVEAWETVSPEGFCRDRTIVLSLQPGLHIRQVVGWVRGVDRRCRDFLDEIYFRDPTDQLRASRELAEDIITAYWQVRGTR